MSKRNVDKLKVAVLRESLYELTGDTWAALLLNQFVYWSARTKDTDAYIREEKAREHDADIELMHGWVYKTADEVADEIMASVSVATIRRRLDELVEKGWLERRKNPKYKWDRTYQYRANIRDIEAELQELDPRYTLRDILKEYYPMFFPHHDANSKLHHASSSDHPADSNTHHDGAVPETTSETSSESTTKSAPDDPDATGELVSYFEELTGIPRPVIKYLNSPAEEELRDDWHYPLERLLDMAKGDVPRVKRVIRQTRAEMKEDGLKIASPRSVFRTVLSNMADGKGKEGGLAAW